MNTITCKKTSIYDRNIKQYINCQNSKYEIYHGREYLSAFFFLTYLKREYTEVYIITLLVIKNDLKIVFILIKVTPPLIFSAEKCIAGLITVFNETSRVSTIKEFLSRVILFNGQLRTL